MTLLRFVEQAKSIDNKMIVKKDCFIVAANGERLAEVAEVCVPSDWLTPFRLILFCC